MNRFLLGGLAVFVMMGIGLFWWQGRAAVEAGAPPPEVTSTAPAPLPSADPGDLNGPELPEATQLTREERRFFRYDRDRDHRISRSEMLSTRADGFRALDKDHNNLLTFEEWAVATVDKFGQADADHDDYLTPAEFRSTAPPPKPRAKCKC
jgi:hypothetical protein